MALPLRKSAAEPARPSAQSRLSVVEPERRAIVARIIELEKKGIRATPNATRSVHEKAVALVNGLPEPPAETIADEGLELQQLYERRDVLDRAVELLKQRVVIEEGERVRQLMERERPESLAAVRKWALSAIQFQKADQEIEQYQRRYSAVGWLPSAAFKLRGMRAAAHEVVRCAEEFVRKGILTRKEASFDD